MKVLIAEEQERTRRSDEIKARLDAKKAERAFMTELIGKSSSLCKPSRFSRGATV
jgi:hypothetical protein